MQFKDKWNYILKKQEKHPFLQNEIQTMNKLTIILFIVVYTTAACTGKKDQKRQGKTPDTKIKNPVQSEEKIKPAPNTKDIYATENEMVFFEGGDFLMGSETGLPNERPVHQVKVDPFYIDKHPVTVAQFRRFIKATGFKTEAEKFGDSGIFNLEKQTWELLPGTSWQKPFGPAGPDAEDNHPATHVSWNDAKAFCEWVGKRLPTEAEWEYAARSGKNTGTKFSWGNEITINGKHQSNTWQGTINSPETDDGYLFTSPVGAFSENEAGLTDMGGNVWQWCADAYRPYPGSKEPYRVNQDLKVIRGGSFFFDQNGENSFTVSGRSMNSQETSLFNTGFRCAQTPPRE